MKTTLEDYEMISPALAAHVREMRSLMDRVADNDRRLWSSHAVVRAFARMFGYDEHIVEGHFGSKGTPHSWISLPTSIGRPIIVDILPKSCFGGPIILDGDKGFSPWSMLYIEDHAFHAVKGNQYETEAAMFIDAILELKDAA